MSPPLFTIVATDIRAGALLLDLLNSSVEVTRYYILLDENGAPIAALGDQESGHSVPIADIPPAVRQALRLIDDWTADLVIDSFT